ncbi:Stk1 family PASTA domain-containing Ser/Thr kinase [Microlunatus endophyticus]|nr:Stk1 family PASTA domain-containing Ser/Thr kinase [Microlunatus endophyticus]
MSTSDPLVGRVLDRRYQIIERVARGGMATVYRANDTRLDRIVACKVMHVGLGDDEDFTRKFDREARAAARLSHPNVVSVFDQGNDLGRPYIVMELVEGRTLRSVIAREAPLNPLRALALIEPVLSALAAAHDAGLVHRDVKPENVLISDRGQLKVGDFGLARAVTGQTSTATAGLLIGTVSYLPPELVLTGKADARSDVYSAGVVLFELLTGRKPHTGETPIQVAYAHVHNDVPAPSSLPTAGPIPDYLDGLIARATARNADARPHDARVMLTQVRRVKSALQAGIPADPELTEDLTVPLRTLRLHAEAAGRPADAAELEDGWAPTTAIAADIEAAISEDSGDPVTGDAADSAASSGTGRPSRVTYVDDEYVDDEPPTVDEPEHTPTDIRFLSRPSAPSRTSQLPGQLPAQVRPVPPNRPRHPSRHRARGWVALIIVLVLAALAGVGVWYYTKGRFTTTPGLTSLPQTKASSIAKESGFTVSSSQSYSETVPKGEVIQTKPRPGGQILRGAKIQLIVSRGPERYPMPKIVGLSEDDAKAALGKGHFDVGSIGKKYSESVDKGKVLSASDDPGTELKRDTKINFVVSAGRQPIAITDYTGKDADSAAAALKKAGFSVAVSSQYSDSVPAGSVISQSPKDGTGFRHDHIKLIKSLGPEMVEVPNVKSMGVQAAKQVLQQKGFKVATSHSSILWLGLGYVASTDPKAGTSAPKGSTITLNLV